MKGKRTMPLLVLVITVVLVNWLGIGLYSSSSAVLDLKAELESLYGPEYTGKLVDGGTEDMEFEVEPKTWFMTNWNLRNTLGLAYKYECRVIFTVRTSENEERVREIVYQAYDPMGAAHEAERAKLDLDSKTESTER